LNTPNHCPVCRARFRATRLCSRCGADLTPIMLIAAKAWQLRETARQSLSAGEFGRAYEQALDAQNLQFTERGESLRLLAQWLSAN
jgi:predicted amidophosphoribosyltransferase